MRVCRQHRMSPPCEGSGVASGGAIFSMKRCCWSSSSSKNAKEQSVYLSSPLPSPLEGGGEGRENIQRLHVGSESQVVPTTFHQNEEN